MAIVLLQAAAAAALSFDDWARAHGRVYESAAEREERRGHFLAYHSAVEAAAAANPHALYGLDEYADWCSDERSGLRGGPIKTAAAAKQPAFDPAAGAPQPIDWVARGAVNKPVSQGRCGTCAQFSATADIEAQWFLAGHGLVKLSEQEMIDCSSYTGPYGMGWVASVHKGLASNASYPLANHSIANITGCRSPCNAAEADPAQSVAHITGATCLPEAIHDNETQMMAWLQHGPLSVSVAAGSFNGYKGGVITACNDTAVDHAVLLVGYGVDAATGLPFWKLRNSWGPAFGEGGYARIQHGVHCIGLRGACQAYIGKAPGGEAAAREGVVEEAR